VWLGDARAVREARREWQEGSCALSIHAHYATKRHTALSL